MEGWPDRLAKDPALQASGDDARRMMAETGLDLPELRARLEAEGRDEEAAWLAGENVVGFALFPDLQPVWEAFHRLSRDRPTGFGPGPIPWSSVERYAERHGITGEEFERFEFLIDRMDNEYLATASRLADERAKAGKTNR